MADRDKDESTAGQVHKDEVDAYFGALDYALTAFPSLKPGDHTPDALVRGPSELFPNSGQGGDDVAHPTHYNTHPSKVECITITEHMSFCLGNVIKYVWRADLKDDAIKDLKKARWYLDREIAKREAAS
ncbi:MAG: DUF3310 domain-containing protein [Pseudomonadota bacterium]